MFHDGTRRTIWRSRHCSVDELLAQIERIPGRIRAALHFRASTCSTVIDENVHPILAGDEKSLAVMHNGTLPDADAAVPESDTVRFVRCRLPAIVATLGLAWHHPAVLEAIRRRAGAVNRFVLLDATGRWEVLDDGEGFVVGQCWLSRPKTREWL